MIRKRWKLFGVVAVALAVVIGLLVWRSKSQTAPQVQTQAVTKGTIVASVSASGQVLTSNVINLATGATGLVKAVYVKDGDQVAAGQKILEITPDATTKQKAASAYSAYLSAKNSLVSAQTNLYTLQSQMFVANQAFMNGAVARELVTTDPVYIEQNADWLAAEAKYKSQQDVIGQAQSSLSNAWMLYQAAAPVVTSPLAGTITNLTVIPGMSLMSGETNGTSIAVIKAAGMPLVSFNLSEIDVPRVQPGQKATIKIDSLSDNTFTGQVVSVDRIGTITSGVVNYPVIIRLDTEAPQILPNMSATASIILETKSNVLLIPSSAVRLQDGQSVVQVKDGSQQQTVPVEVGISSDTQTEIISGLSEGDQIIVATLSSTGSQSGGSVFSPRGFGGATRIGR